MIKSDRIPGVDSFSSKLSAIIQPHLHSCRTDQNLSAARLRAHGFKTMPLLRGEGDLGQHDVEVDVDRAADAGNEFPDPFSTPPKPIMQRSLSRRSSEESIRTELCEGPILENPLCKQSTPEQRASHNVSVSDRAELIERLKRGESPTWIPNRHVG